MRTGQDVGVYSHATVAHAPMARALHQHAPEKPCVTLENK